ncbi:MAG: alpha/beta hydrolase [Armatimonadota bacterium]
MSSININGVLVSCEGDGTGLPIVFIPGLVGSKEWFSYQFTGLRESYRTISYDVRMARSMATYTLDLLIEDLAQLLTALKVESAVLVGHDFGAMIAQNMARIHRERVDGLVLISAFSELHEASSDEILDWMSPGPVRIESVFQSILRRYLGLKPAAPAADIGKREWLQANSARLTSKTLNARINLIQEFDSTKWLPDIESPTLVIAGAQDSAEFLAQAQVLYEGIPNAELEVIENSEHFCFYMRHDLVNSAIDEFMKELLKEL